MRPRIDVILERCIEEGVLSGYRRAHKHIDEPDETALVDTITTEIMGKIYELFTFDFEDP